MGVTTPSVRSERRPRVKLHRNAKTTPHMRALLVDRIQHQQWTPLAAASAAGISVRSAHTWSCPTKRARRRPPFSSAPSRGLRAAVSASRVLKDNGGNYCSRRFQAVAARHRFDSNAHARTGRRPVARPNDSSKHCSASGPMRDRTRTRRDAHGHCDRSSAPITASGRTPRLDISRRVPVFQGLLNEQPC
jgi:hypothetical protein